VERSTSVADKLYLYLQLTSSFQLNQD